MRGGEGEIVEDSFDKNKNKMTMKKKKLE